MSARIDDGHARATAERIEAMIHDRKYTCTALPWKTALTVVAVVSAGALALSGCTADYAENGNSPYILLMTGINDGNPLTSDVRTDNGTVCPDFVALRVENHPKNPNITSGQVGYRGDMTIERYEVHYFRSDGRSTEGVDVPYSITGNVAQEIQVDADATLNLEVVRRQAKLEPPLSTLVGGGGALIVTMFAEVTLHARTTVGQTTNAVSARLQIDFGDFVGGGDTCPSQ
jgi:hypothetical protein